MDCSSRSSRAPGAAASYRGNRAKIRIFPAPSQFPPHLLGAGAKIGGAHRPLPCGEIIRTAYRALPHALAPSTPASRAASSRNVR